MTKWVLTIGICLMIGTASAFADNILVNPGFESGALAPWVNSTDFCGGCTWSVTGADSNSGAFSAEVSGNRLIEQIFAAIDTSLITEASLWLRMPETGIAFIAFRYSDTSTGGTIFDVGADWAKFDVTSLLDPGKSLVGFGVYGCSGCPGDSLTRADDFVVDGHVPEPGSLSLLILGLVGVAGATGRRRLAKRS